LGKGFVMVTQAEKGRTFESLHERRTAFLIPNPWDIGTARMLAHVGFEALATTSMGFALSMGKQDNAVGREAVLEHAKALTSAVDLPVSADLESGFGDTPEMCAQTIRLAAGAGLVGGSIEDFTGRSDNQIYELQHAAERIRAAAEAADSLPFPFMLTARAENFLRGRPDLKDTIHRLQVYQEAGADVLYAPGLTTKQEIAEVLRSVDRPINVLMGIPGVPLTLEELSALGVRRISVGSGLYRVAHAAFLRAAREMKETGRFSALSEEKMTGREIAKLL
jgi:2-methylisocitrate lyase-like PEP mutase family enzyme